MRIAKWPGTPAWVPVLFYHRVVPVLPRHDPFYNCISTATFQSHLAWLAKRRYRSLPLSRLGPLFDSPERDRATLSPKSVVITFDDGYQDNYLHAWPLLRRYGFTATIFLVSDAIGGDNSFDTAFGSERAPMLSVAEIREMHQHQIDFGSHTCSHPATLVRLTDGQLADELGRSRSTIEDILEAPVEHFSYPHSQLDERVEAAVAQAGYRLACAGVGTRFSRFRVHRVDPSTGRGPRIETQIQWRRLKRLTYEQLHERKAGRS